MALRPICEPVELPMGASVLAERVEYSSETPASGRFLHFHDVSELVLFGGVAGSFSADGKTYDLRRGAAVFVPSMRHHDFDLKAGASDWILVQIDPYIVEQLALQPAFGRLNRPFCAFPDEHGAHRIGVIAEWLVEAAQADALDPLVIRLVELLLSAVVAAPEAGRSGRAGDVSHVEQLFPAVERLRRDPATSVPLEEAAGLCRLSPAYFSRRFKQVFGMNFTDYARVYRLHLAARRIATTGSPVSEIAYGLGFSSPSHFTARFNERFGMTPRQYRKRIRERR
jgi:AraC-like DNA-binding protein